VKRFHKCALLTLIATSHLPAMQQVATSKKTNNPFFKEMRMQLYEDSSARTFVKVFGGILAVVGIFKPLTALSSATITSAASLILYWQNREQDIQDRIEAKDAKAYEAFTHGPRALMEQMCQSDEYLQTDSTSLQTQNTRYLIETLKNYNLNPHHKPYHWALTLLLKYHADTREVAVYFNQNVHTHKNAIAWLARNQAPLPNQ
jgi:hypothetical protein